MMKHKTTTDKWREYERIKSQLRRLNLSPEEYKRRLDAAAKRLGV